MEKLRTELMQKFNIPTELTVQEARKSILAIIAYCNGLIGIPKTIVIKMLYVDKKGYVAKGQFVLKPCSEYKLKNKEVRSKFTLLGGSKFIENFINQLIGYLKNYMYYLKLSVNLEKLNEHINGLNTQNISYKFEIGEGILDIGENYIVLGILEGVAEKVLDLPIFDENNVKYKDNLINTFKECSNSYDIVKIKNQFTRDLGIYQRKSLNTLLRKLVKRRIENVRVGVGYVDEPNMSVFAIIEKIAITEGDVEKLSGDYILSENVMPSAQERKENRLIIMTRYKVEPFDKNTYSTVTIGIKDLLKSIEGGK